MTHKRFKKLIKEHPYLIDNIYSLSRTEAEKIYLEGFPSIEEIVERARRKYELPAGAWNEFDDAFARKHAREQMYVADNNKVGNVINSIGRHRRLVAICVALLLLLSFFALVPTGRALAKEIYEFVVRIFDNKLEIMPNSNSNSYKPTDEYEILLEADTIVKEYQSISQCIESIGFIPYIFDADGITMKKITYEMDKLNSKSLTINYYSDSGAVLYVRQDWDIDSEVTIGYGSIEGYQEMKIYGGQVLYYTFDPIDKETLGVLILSNSIVNFSTVDEKLFSQLQQELKEKPLNIK